MDSGIFHCREVSGSATLAFGFHRGSTPTAFDIHLKDCCVVDETINDGECHGGIGENPVPFTEGLVGGEHE